MDTSSIKVEISSAPAGDFFDFGWDDWYDISADVKEYSFSRGRSRLLDQFSAGSCSITLDNRSRQFEPNNTESPYYPNIEIRRGLRIYRDTGSGIVPLFAGYIDAWEFEYDPDGNSLATIRAYDMLGRIAAADLGTLKFGRQLSGSRVAGILKSPGLQLDLNNSPWYINDYGLSSTTDTRFITEIAAGSAYTREGQGAASALTDLYRCALVENAEFFAKASGALAYRNLDWDTTSIDTYVDYQWNFSRNPRAQIDALYYTKGTRDSSILSTTGIKSESGKKNPSDPTHQIVIYDDDAAPGIDIVRSLWLNFWVTATSSTSSDSFTANLELYNELGVQKTVSQVFDVASSSAWTELSIEVTDIEPGSTGIRFWITNEDDNVTSFWVTKLGFYTLAEPTENWDGGTTDTATENYGWDTGTRLANIKKSRKNDGVITFKANNAFDDIYSVYLYADKTSSTYDVKDALEITNPTSFTVENSSSLSFTGGYAKVIPLGTSWVSTKSTADIDFQVLSYDDAGTNGYQSIQLNYGTEEFYNQVKIQTDGDFYLQKDTVSDLVFTKTGQVTIAKSNDASIKTYGAFNYAVPDALTSDKTESLELADRILTAHQEPEYRIEAVTVRLTNLNSSTLTAEIWDQIQVQFTPNQTGGVINAEMYLIGVDHTMTSEYYDVTLKLATRLPMAPAATRMPAIFTSISGDTYSDVAPTISGKHYYLSMYHSGALGSGKATIQKWTSDDVLVWQKTLGNVVNYADYKLHLATDASDNLYYAQFAFSSYSPLGLVKISPSGSVLWSKNFSTISITDLTTDSDGNVYFVGEFDSATTIVKLNSSGAVQWQKAVTITNGSPKVAVTPDGSTIYVGLVKNPGLVLISLDSAGSTNWQKALSISSDGYSYMRPYLTTATSAGVWLSAHGYSAYAVHFQADGTVDKSFSIADNDYVAGVEIPIVLGSDGYLYVRCFERSGTYTSGYIFRKYDTNGKLILSIWPRPNILSSGVYTNVTTTYNSMKYNKDGTLLAAGAASWTGGPYPVKFKIYALNPIKPPAGKYYVWSVASGKYIKGYRQGGSAASLVTSTTSTASLTIGSGSLSISSGSASLTTTTDTTTAGNNAPTIV